MIDAFYMFFILHLRNDSTIPPISSKIPAPRPGWRTDPNGFCYSAAITSCEKAVQWHQAASALREDGRLDGACGCGQLQCSDELLGEAWEVEGWGVQKRRMWMGLINVDYITT